MTDGVCFSVTKGNYRRDFGHDFPTGVTKSPVPEHGRSSSGEGGGARKMQRVERSGAIAPENLLLRRQVLHRTANRVKLNGTIVVSSELADRNEIFNK
jgi:hypothetical protein